MNRLTQISSVPSGKASCLSRSTTFTTRRITDARDFGRRQLLAYEYDSLGQVRSGKKYWSAHAVAGQQFEYGFDDIGNRKNTKCGGDETAWNLRSANYGANSLNQYTIGMCPDTWTSWAQLCHEQRDGELTNCLSQRGVFEKELAVGNGSARCGRHDWAATGQRA